MIRFLQLALTPDPETPTIIRNGSGIGFNVNQHLGSGGSALAHSPSINPSEIEIKISGTYFAVWFVSTQSGLSSTGSNWELSISTANGSPYPVHLSSSHVKISPTSGSAIIDLGEEQVPAILQLKNVSGSDLTLSSRNLRLASFSLFEIDGEPAPVFKPTYFHGQVDLRQHPTDFVVFTKERIPFNVTKKSRDISLDVTTGIGLITFEALGVYTVHWEIPIDTTEDTHDVSLGLYVAGGEVSRSYLPFPVGIISGSAIIEVSVAGTTAELINLTPCGIRITDTANITIVQIDW